MDLLNFQVLKNKTLSGKSREWTQPSSLRAHLFGFFLQVQWTQGLRERMKSRKIESYNLKQFPSNHFIPNLLYAPSQPLQWRRKSVFSSDTVGNHSKARKSTSERKNCKLLDLVNIQAVNRRSEIALLYLYI